MKSSNDIGTIFLFSSLNEKELQIIKGFSSIKTYTKGEMIFFDTEPYFGFFNSVRLQGKSSLTDKESNGIHFYTVMIL
jgi:hypothetical protein